MSVERANWSAKQRDSVRNMILNNMSNQEILGVEPFKSQSRDKVLNLINNERQALKKQLTKKRKVLEEFDNNRDDIFVTKSNPRLLPEKDDDDISNLIDDSFLGSLPTSEACAEFY
ncbi:hypothetical protein HDV06_003605, partial [Boothiomyces sp. JEL0866]